MLPTSLEWAITSAPCEIARRCEADPDSERWLVLRDQHLIAFTPTPLVGEAAQVLNGVERRFSTAPTNMWISRPGEPLPQSLTLDFGRPQAFREVHLIFDTLTEVYTDMPWDAGDRASPMCVRAYDLAAHVASEWRPLVSVEDNYHRFRRHAFDPVPADQLRLTVRAVHDPERFTARVYAVRVYDR